jgi:hypothetical protein
MVDKRIFKVMLNPSPGCVFPITSLHSTRRPVRCLGNGIPALANDLTDVINATLRALVNNVAISSGPQVFYDEELMSPNQNDSLYPWKRWKSRETRSTRIASRSTSSSRAATLRSCCGC